MNLVPVLTDIQRQEIGDSRSPFSAEDRVCVAMCFILSGGNNALTASKATKTLETEVPAGTIRQWKSRSWWPQAMELGRQMIRKDMAAKYQRLLVETEKEIFDRVKDGDTRVVNGELVRVPVTLRDLVGAHAVVADKEAMMHGEPTGRREDTGIALAHKLVELLQQQGERQIKEMPSTLEGEYTEVATPLADSDEVS